MATMLRWPPLPLKSLAPEPLTDSDDSDAASDTEEDLADHHIKVAGMSVRVANSVEYSRLRPAEVLASLYTTTCRRMYDAFENDESLPSVDGQPYVELFCGTKVGDKFNVPLRICLFLRDYSALEHDGFESSEANPLALRHANYQLYTAFHVLTNDICNFEASRQHIAKLHTIEYMKRMDDMLSRKIESQTDSDHRDSDDSEAAPESSDESDEYREDDDDDPPRPRRRRPRRQYSRMGLQRDTKQQQVDLFGVKVRPPRGLKTPQNRTLHGDMDAHIAELVVSVVETTTRPRPGLEAATFSDGAQLRMQRRAGEPDELVYESPDGKVASDVAVTARMIQDLIDPALKDDYLERQKLILQLKEELGTLFDKMKAVFQVRILVGEVGRCAVVPFDSSLAVQRTVAMMLFQSMVKVECEGEGEGEDDNSGFDSSDWQGGDSSESDDSESESDDSDESYDGDDDDDDESHKRKREGSESDDESESDGESESESDGTSASSAGEGQ